MTRMIIIGCGGAGKSTFSRQCGELFGTPVVHLDTIFWKPGWKSISREEFTDAQHRVLQQPEWIIDGHFGGTLDMRVAETNTVVYFDFPTYLCMWGVLKRWGQYYFLRRKRQDMTEGNAENLDLEHLQWILEFRRTQRPRIMKLLNEMRHSKEVVVFHTRADVKSYLKFASDKCSQTNNSSEPN